MIIFWHGRHDMEWIIDSTSMNFDDSTMTSVPLHIVDIRDVGWIEVPWSSLHMGCIKYKFCS